MPSLSTTLSAHWTRGPRFLCAPRNLRIGDCVCCCVWVCAVVPGPAPLIACGGPPAPPPPPPPFESC